MGCQFGPEGLTQVAREPEACFEDLDAAVQIKRLQGFIKGGLADNEAIVFFLQFFSQIYFEILLLFYSPYLKIGPFFFLKLIDIIKLLGLRRQ